MRLTKYRGKWYVSFKEGDKYRRISTGTHDREAAERIARDIYGAAEVKAIVTVSDLWHKAQEDKVGRPVYQNMEYHWKSIGPYFGRFEPHHIKVKDCRDYARMRRDAGKAESTIATELKHLRSALRWGEKHGMIPEAPYIEVPADSEPRERFLSRKEFRALLDHAASPHIRLAMILLLTTAGRIAAVLELTWDRVDFDRDRIHLSLSNRGKGRAVVPMTEQLKSELKRAYVLRTSQHVIEYGGKPVKSIRRGIVNAANRAGIEGVTPHVFRHTAAVWMAEDGHPMEEISQFLGHKDINITRRVYAKFSPEHLKSLATTLAF
ncbi:site-specific integrase [Pseudovibrio sp. SPO723]|uniref:tyrosine-type recombinase/integrase n=1 Tax=Nesiotobacter zosterae TaxID=392721 RepID=UPI0029C5D9A3|nr:site-specific integrase [Pseudovibrio sp. SPO723]MDX5592530.1 site-specific integrase [Pseudovibrio sp. SPO723]